MILSSNGLTDVDMMILAQLSYYDLPNGIYDKNGKTKKAISLAEMLKDTAIRKTLEKYFGDNYTKLLEKAEKNNFQNQGDGVSDLMQPIGAIIGCVSTLLDTLENAYGAITCLKLFLLQMKAI